MVSGVVNEIVLGMAGKVKAIYKDKGDYPIYTDNEEQGLVKPCFFIKVLNGDESREIGLSNKFYKDLLNLVVIGYTLDGNTEVLNDMIDNLYGLEYIELSDGSLIRAVKLHHKIEDGVLHFFVDYKLFVKKDDVESMKMGNYDFSEGVKIDEGI